MRSFKFFSSGPKFLSVAIISLFVSVGARAAPITYTISGITDGTLQNLAAGTAAPVSFFSPSAFKITAFADTANVTPHPLIPSPIVAFAVVNQKVTIDVAGLGVFNLIDPGYTQLFRPSQGIVISQLGQSPYIGGQTFAATTYDLSRPLAETALNITDKSIFYTDRGVLVLRDKFAVSDGKFSATFGQVPLPSTLVLLLLPMLVIGFSRRLSAS